MIQMKRTEGLKIERITIHIHNQQIAFLSDLVVDRSLEVVVEGGCIEGRRNPSHQILFTKWDIKGVSEFKRPGCSQTWLLFLMITIVPHCFHLQKQ
ncbi:hypothetical protein HanRHA438_Chr13g0583111 [Helianthus annuus]|nr:hypothetical protein HanIR_Chr13g0622871 [Helianthus annuus]KAJ0856839.1 hypothetical protein HanRHA438_Chr13g0583111 [Helianthus annuus]